MRSSVGRVLEWCKKKYISRASASQKKVVEVEEKEENEE